MKRPIPGFAVLADEVPTLAQQTRKSTTDIEAFIMLPVSVLLSWSGPLPRPSVQIATVSDQQVSVTWDLSRNMEAVNESANMALTGSQEISPVTDEQARLARQLQELAHEFKIGAARQVAE